MSETGTQVDLRIGDTWTDITADAYLRDGLRIDYGRRSEGARVDAGQCSLTLKSPAGKYSPRNPLSPYYGLIGRNTPLRVSVDGPSYLAHDGDAGSYASTPSTPLSGVTTELDIRVEATADWHADTSTLLVCQSQGTERSWLLGIINGSLRAQWRESSGTSSFWFGIWTLPRIPRRAAVRGTISVNTAASTGTVNLYWAPSLDDTWTQIHSGPLTFSGPTLPIYIGTAPIQTSGQETFWSPFAGSIHRLQIRDSIDGTPVVDTDFTAQTAGDTSFTDTTGLPWTILGGAEISNRDYRFTGEVAAWPVRWHPSGHDVRVPIQAAGILRRLRQGTKPLLSAMRRELASPSREGIVAYWPGEDGLDATQLAAATDGLSPMQITGDIDVAAYSDWSASDALPIMRDGTLTGQIPPYTSTEHTFLRMFVRLPPDGVAATTSLLDLHTSGTARLWRLTANPSGQLQLQVYDQDDAQISVSLSSGPANGLQLSLAVELTQDGPDIDYRVIPFSVGASTLGATVPIAGMSGTVGGHTVGRATRLTVGVSGGLGDTAVGHIALANASDAYAQTGGAIIGWAGEEAAGRIGRLCREEGLPVQITAPDSTVTMGPQRSARLLELLQECEEADGGILHEARDQVALAYRSRESVYNQPPRLALDYTQPGLAPPLDPTEDDELSRNDITVSRPGGSSARAVLESGPLSVQPPPNGIGSYEMTVEANVATDEQLLDQAGWRLHLGTVDEPRYPAVRVAVHTAPALAADIAEMHLLDKASIAHPPPWLPPGDIGLLAEGWTEDLGIFTRDLTLVCSSASPWTVTVVDDDVLGRADTDGSELAAAVDAEDTSLQVAVTAGPLWVTDPAELPLDIRVGGEVMTVTAVTGSSSPQDFTVVRSVNGIAKAHPAGADVRLAQPAIVAL